MNINEMARPWHEISPRSVYQRDAQQKVITPVIYSFTDTLKNFLRSNTYYLLIPNMNYISFDSLYKIQSKDC